MTSSDVQAACQVIGQQSQPPEYSARTGRPILRIGLLLVAVLLLTSVSLPATFPVAAPTEAGRPRSGAGANAIGATVGNITHGGVGAPPGYGLMDPSRLQPHAPIFINNDTGFTAPNGVRSGNGTAADPYIISDWIIDGNLYPDTPHMIWIESTSKVVVIENVEITDLNGTNQWSGIKIGEFDQILRTSNITIRHDEFDTEHAYGVWVNEGSSNITLEANRVQLNGNRDWVYGLCFMRNVLNSRIVGNYINARSTFGNLTVGIQSGDFEVTPDRPVRGLVIERNTVMNATAASIVSDDNVGTIIRRNLVFHDYPGMHQVQGWPVRGIFVEEISQYDQVYENEVYDVQYGIAIASPFGSYFSNVVHDVSYAVYVYAPNAFWNSRGTRNDTVYNITYWDLGVQAITVPSGAGHTVLDIGPGVTPTNFTPILLLLNQTATRVTYSWIDMQVNVSIALATRLVYDLQLSAFRENLTMSWASDSLAVTVKRLTATNSTFILQSGSNVDLAGTGLSPEAYYVAKVGPQLVANVSTSPTGQLAVPLPASIQAIVYVYFAGYLSQPPPSDSTTPVVVITSPTNGGYVPGPSVRLSWTATDPQSGIREVQLSLDGRGSIDVTGLSGYTLSPVPDGRHDAEITATNNADLASSSNVTFFVDTIPPHITILTPTNGSSVSTTTVFVSWNVTDTESGVQTVETRLDIGPYVDMTSDGLVIGGLSSGVHLVSVLATDRAGNSAQAAVLFGVAVGQGSSGNETGGPGPAVSSVAYTPDNSTVDIAFRSSMDASSVAASIRFYPSVHYSVKWIDDAHLELVIDQPLEPGGLYQLVLNTTATDTADVRLSHPFLFQFFATNGGATPSLLSSVPMVLVILAILLGLILAAAGVLVHRSRKNAAAMIRRLD